MANQRNNEWWRPDRLAPAFIVIGPYFLNKLIYIYFPGAFIFEVTDYACRTFSLGALYWLFRRSNARPPIPWRLSLPSGKGSLLVLAGAIILLVSDVVERTSIPILNAYSGYLTAYPVLPAALRPFDDTAGMVYVAFSEEAVVRFYLMNLLLLRGWSPVTSVIGSTLIFALLHWSYGLGNVVFAALAGLVLSVIYLRSRNLVVPIIVHAIDDAFIFSGGAACVWSILAR